jgi:hypothetical protein
MPGKRRRHRSGTRETGFRFIQLDMEPGGDGTLPGKPFGIDVKRIRSRGGRANRDGLSEQGGGTWKR